MMDNSHGSRTAKTQPFLQVSIIVASELSFFEMETVVLLTDS